MIRVRFPYNLGVNSDNQGSIQGLIRVMIRVRFAFRPVMTRVRFPYNFGVNSDNQGSIQNAGDDQGSIPLESDRK